MTWTWRRWLVIGMAVVISLIVVVATPGVASAHPLGNFTSNTAVRLVVAPDGIDLRYVLDLAEIPTARFRQSADTDDSGTVGDDEATAMAARRCTDLLRGLDVTLDGTTVVADLGGADLAFPEGQAGLPTTRLTCDSRLAIDTIGTDVTVDDTNVPDRIGWREVTAVGDRVTLLASTVPEASDTNLLRRYPDSAQATPRHTTTASLAVRAGGPPAPQDSLEGRGGATEVDGPGLFERLSLAYTDLVATRTLTPAFALLAIALAMLLGTLHALAPGHGKTVIAAYVVGERGTARQALGIGATVAITHTIGVVVLGVLLSTSEVLAPERLYPWLGLASGALVVAIGIGLIRRARHHRGPHHAHAREHVHAAHPHHHDLPDPGLGWRNLVTLGIAGGMAPSPSALLVLLGAIALDRVWFGLLLVVAYGLGLAGLLVIGGLLLVRIRGAAERLLELTDRPRLRRLTRHLPVATGVAVMLGGVTIAARGWLV